jgi:hypothetical protein
MLAARLLVKNGAIGLDQLSESLPLSLHSDNRRNGSRCPAVIRWRLPLSRGSSLSSGLNLHPRCASPLGPACRPVSGVQLKGRPFYGQDAVAATLRSAKGTSASWPATIRAAIPNNSQ